MNNIASKIGALIVILLILFFGLKSCVMTVWKSPEQPMTYAIHGSDGRSLAMILLPENETIFLYTEEKADFIEASLTKMRGTYGTHYFWRLWNVGGPEAGSGLFGYRIYPEGVEPVVMETTVLKKFIHGTSTPTLRNEGDITHPIILFTAKALRFGDMWLEEEPTNPDLVKSLLVKLKPKP
jgi:hypothetical protein